MIKIDNLTKHFHEVVALNKFSAEIPEGTVGVLGPNGAGKTTLIKILLGLIKSTSGSATIFGEDIVTSGVEIRQKIGYMPEQECYIPDLNAVEYVAHFAQLVGLPRKDALQRAHEVLYYVGLEESRYRKLKTYSMGMKQRVKLAQALAHDPDTIFVDEPTNGMDPSGRDEMLDMLLALANEDGKNIIMSSHLLPDVEKVCKHVIVINKGKLLANGEINELKKTDRQTITVRVKNNPQKLVDALTSHNISATLGKNEVKVTHSGKSEDILKIIQQNDLQLRYFGQSTDSLEDFFMKLLQKSQGESTN